MSAPRIIGIDPAPPLALSRGPGAHSAHCGGPANHAVQFYETDAVLSASVGDFLAEGIRAGEPTLVIATRGHRTGLASRLRALRVDVRGAERSGVLLWLDAHETLARFMRDGLPDRERFRAAIDPIIEAYARRGTGSVRAYGEMVDVLWQEGGRDAALRLERLWNEVVTRYDVTLLCAYSMPLAPVGECGDGRHDVLALHGRFVEPASVGASGERHDPWRALESLDGVSRALRVSDSDIMHRRELEARIAALMEREREAERRLADRERQLSDAQRIAGIGSFALSLRAHEPSGRTPGTWTGELSSEAVRLLGRGTATVDVTLDALVAMLPSGNDAAVARLREVALHGGVIERQEMRLTRPDGGARLLELHAERIDDPDSGTPLRLVGTLLDVTVRRASDAAQLAGQRLESIGLLAGGIAHDFNNLLGSVLGNADLLCEQLPIADPLRALAEEIRLAATRSAELTRQLLAYAGNGSTPLADVDILSLTGDVATLLHSAIPSGGMLCVDRPDESSPRWAVRGDRAALLQVLLNLVTNAADALPTSGGRVNLRLRFEMLDGNALRALHADSVTGATPPATLRPTRFAVVEVRDNGVGMSEETRARMFDPFFTTKAKGRGLGLSATLGILRAHRAAMTVESAPGAGTVFRVYIPVLDRRMTARPPEPVRAKVEVPAVPRASRALVADDDALLRGLIARMMKTFGFEVVEAGDGASALAAFDEKPGAFDIVLLDLTMPELGGVDTMRALRGRAPMLPVLLMSGYGEGAPVVRTRDGEPAVTFISKPFDRATLQSHLATALDAARRATM